MTTKACILNTKPDLNGNVVSLECLKAMVADVDQVPFSVFFEERIGSAFNFYVNEEAGELLCDVEMTDADVSLSGLVPVVGYSFTDYSDCSTYRLHEVSLTNKPASVGTWIEET